MSLFRIIVCDDCHTHTLARLIWAVKSAAYSSVELMKNFRPMSLLYQEPSKLTRSMNL